MEKKKVTFYIMTPIARKRFECWLIKNGITKKDFAEKCGISKQYLNGIISGKKNITQKVREQFKKGGYDLV